MVPYNLEESPDFPVHFRDTSKFPAFPWMEFVHTLNIQLFQPHLRDWFLNSPGLGTIGTWYSWLPQEHREQTADFK